MWAVAQMKEGKKCIVKHKDVEENNPYWIEEGYLITIDEERKKSHCDIHTDFVEANWEIYEENGKSMKKKRGNVK